MRFSFQTVIIFHSVQFCIIRMCRQNMLYFIVFCFALPALSIANVTNYTQSSMKACLRLENVTNAANVAETCFKDLVTAQILNTTNTSLCTSLNDLTTKLDEFYKISLKTCYNETLEKKYAPGKQILMAIINFIFKDNKLAELSRADQFSCLKTKEIKETITKCINFKHARSNDTSNSYLWSRRVTLNFNNKACSDNTNHMKNCTESALVTARCEKPLIKFIGSMYDIILSNCNDREEVTIIKPANDNKGVNPTIATLPKETGKGSSTQLTAFSSVTLLFIRLIPIVIDWVIL